eukprot:TRINITY_DN73825_c0_g1_i1.p1 TRINITY_DN73825_c0_g1~~TRINITY_DN73825_c0_g1_i1.p1  ORF type:complete len:221 (+),score=63.40 TRINITY_DN73825_c0_g1_i1:260-922(+)
MLHRQDAAAAAGEDASAVQPPAAKHRLQHTWCLWALLRDQSTKDDWHGSQMNVREFSFVEDFWRVQNNIKRPSQFGVADFSFFKKDIAPAWEDEACRRGGRWVAKLDKGKAEVLDEAWLTLMLTLMGENFQDVNGACVCGAVVSSRAKGGGKVALWLSEREEAKVRPIGEAFLSVLKGAGCNVETVSFEDFAREQASPASGDGAKAPPLTVGGRAAGVAV